MYTFYNNMLPEKRKAWRNAYEIKMAALEHDKRRFQMIDEYDSTVNPRVQAKRNRRPGWLAIVKTP